MAEPNEPKKETVRITLPSRQPEVAPTQEHDTVRIDLPPESAAEPPPAPVSRSAAAPPVARTMAPPGRSDAVAPPRRLVPPPPMPASVPKPAPAPPRIVPAPPVSAPSPPLVAKTPLPRPPAPAAPVNIATAKAAPPPAPRSEPKKETSRIPIGAEPPKPVRMSKTQPLVTLTATPIAPPPTSMKVAPAETIISSIPMSLCWALVAISAAILLIEIWTYIS